MCIVTLCQIFELTTITTAFGFLGGKEVYDEGVGNLGLLDRKPGQFLEE